MLLRQKQASVSSWNCSNIYTFASSQEKFLFYSFRIGGGELFERVIDDDFILTERLCELYTMQICEGVNFIHSCKILHLDMKVRSN